MQLNRRSFGLLAAAAAGATALPRAAFADEALVKEAIMAFTGGVEPTEGGVTLGAPEIAENGNTVPIEVSAGDGTEAIMILAAGNPNPGVATFHFTKLSGEIAATTRIRLAKTQDVIAVARLGDGSFGMTRREVKVTIGGCGG